MAVSRVLRAFALYVVLLPPHRCTHMPVRTTPPADAQVAILSTVMDGVLLDLERARMEREDFRQGNSPCAAICRDFRDPNCTTKAFFRRIMTSDRSISGFARMQAQIQEMNDTATAAMAELEAGIYEAHEAMDDPARDSSALRIANNRMAEAYNNLSTIRPEAMTPRL